jgi:mannose-6-phosphate isomerase
LGFSLYLRGALKPHLKSELLMPSLGPFRVEPQFKERPWGARDLGPIYDYKIQNGAQPVGEVWLTGDECRAATGELAGKGLGELARKFGKELTGEVAPQAERFPLLIKFLFPREKLSVQVHPDDEAARRAGEPCGKTECWYVLAAEKGAQVALGLKPGTTLSELRRAIQETRAEQLLRWMEIHPGEMIYSDAGTVHAIGPGSILVETQQNSDTTYRLYDYGRPRPLHVEQGLAAVKERTGAGKVVRTQDRSRDPNDHNLITSPCFQVDLYRAAEGNEQIITRHLPPSSAQVLVALAGRGAVKATAHEPVEFERGQAVVIPAAVNHFSVRAATAMEYLRMSLPQEKVPEPRTSF